MTLQRLVAGTPLALWLAVLIVIVLLAFVRVAYGTDSAEGA